MACAAIEFDKRLNAAFGKKSKFEQVFKVEIVMKDGRVGHYFWGADSKGLHQFIVGRVAHGDQPVETLVAAVDFIPHGKQVVAKESFESELVASVRKVSVLLTAQERTLGQYDPTRSVATFTSHCAKLSS